MRCLNCCDIFSVLLVKKNESLSGILGKRDFDRIYVGSYFCSRLFLDHIIFEKLFEALNDTVIPITLVLPVVSERDLEDIKNRIGKIIENYHQIDEITVNDLGMAGYIFENYPSIKMNLGRLFFKDQRDVRNRDYFGTVGSVSALSDFEWFSDRYKVNAVEVDCTNKQLDLTKYKGSFETCLHTPYTYVSTGNICKFASIGKDIQHKFRANDYCKNECSSIFESYKAGLSSKAPNANHFRIGRTIYSRMPQYDTEGFNREIYVPYDEFIEAEYKL